MKQLTFILFLFFSFTFQNYSNQESYSKRQYEEADNSRSISNISDDDCNESGGFNRVLNSSNIKSELKNKKSGKKGFHLPDLKNEEFNQSHIHSSDVTRQSIFDDYDPDKI